MMDTSSVEHALDLLLPHTVTVLIVTLAIPGWLYAVGFRFQLRTDRRKEEESVGGLMQRLAVAQNTELSRLMAESETLRTQVEILSQGRFRLQECLDGIREQLIAARVLIHDYERRLGLPETTFPPISLPISPERAKTGS